MSLDIGSEYRTYSYLANAKPDVVRQAIRQNRYVGHTAGLCESRLQCNLVILPHHLADDFQKFCDVNPVFCPLVGKSETGEFGIEALGRDLDIRTDLPLYNIYEKGQLIGTQRDVVSHWRDDFVAFAIGCSFTFERALMQAGIAMRHIEQDVTVPMFKTNKDTTSVGRFSGPAVVSMRPIKTSDLQQTKDICALYPHAHGVPIHVGDPSEIGIADIMAPDWGEAVSILEDELPVFWGCGVTSQVAIINAGPDICITHAPGAMLITEIDELSKSERRTAGPLDEDLH